MCSLAGVDADGGQGTSRGEDGGETFRGTDLVAMCASPRRVLVDQGGGKVETPQAKLSTLNLETQNPKTQNPKPQTQTPKPLT